MIQKGSDLDFSKQTFGIIFCGAPGVGKTTLALSDGAMGADTLVIDLEHGIGRTNALHRANAKILTATTYEEVKADIESPEAAASKTIVIDTAGSLIEYMKDWAIRKNSSCRQRDGSFNWRFGSAIINNELKELISLIKEKMNKNLVYIFHTDETSDKDGNPQQRLRCEGKFRNTVWTGIDFGGYIQMLGGQRVISFTPDDDYPAKGSHGIFGKRQIPALNTNVGNNFLKNLIDEARANMKAENDSITPLKDGYDGVMATVSELVKDVKDVESVNSCYTAIKGMQHFLTSQSECNKMLYTKAVSLGLKYSKAEDAYVAGDQA